MLKMYILGVGDMVGVFALRLRERLAESFLPFPGPFGLWMF